MSYSKRGEALRLADKANAPSPNSHPNIFICDKINFLILIIPHYNKFTFT